MSFKELGPKEQSADFYLLSPPRQPKREIAEHIESEGILVPRRFSGLDEALASGKPFIVRSEHPQDYNGVSDLLSSYPVTQEWISDAREEYGWQPKKINWEYVLSTSNLIPRFEAVEKTIAQLGGISQAEFEDNLKHVSRREISEYCRLLGVNPQEFFSKISYSYWELLGGHNRTVIADSAIPKRYHIFTTTPDDEAKHGYAIVEDGKVITSISSELSSKLDSDAPSLVGFYESIRNFDRFDKNHCPIVEAQTVNGNHYFLQYHRATDFNPSSFILTRESEDEIEAIFTRGATPSEGIRVNVNIHDGYKRILNQEEGGLDLDVSRIFTELMLRRRKTHFFRSNSMERVVRNINNSHLPKSRLFKPPISIVLSSDSINFLMEGVSLPSNSVLQIQVRVISDGRRAYIKKLSGPK